MKTRLNNRSYYFQKNGLERKLKLPFMVFLAIAIFLQTNSALSHSIKKSMKHKSFVIKKTNFGDKNRQQVQIDGTVTDESGSPLPGASIVEKGSTNGTTTDFDGIFSINITNQNAVLVISYIGWVSRSM